MVVAYRTQFLTRDTLRRFTKSRDEHFVRITLHFLRRILICLLNYEENESSFYITSYYNYKILKLAPTMKIKTSTKENGD